MLPSGLVRLFSKAKAMYGGLFGKKRAKSEFLRQLRPTDVFLVGHPKSGNTWLAYMLAIILFKDFEHRVTLGNLKDFLPYIHGSDDKIASFAALPNVRVFRNERPIYPELYPKTIYIVRDPRAVLVSYFHHYRTVKNDTRTSLEDFTEEYLRHGRLIKKFEPYIERWDRQVTLWTNRVEYDRHVMVVKYEEMNTHRQSVLERVMQFSRIPYNEELLTLAVSRGSFKAMRADEEQYGAESYPGEIAQRGRFVRRGKLDGWQEEMPLNLAKRIERTFKEAMQRTGYL